MAVAPLYVLSRGGFQQLFALNSACVKYRREGLKERKHEYPDNRRVSSCGNGTRDENSDKGRNSPAG